MMLLRLLPLFALAACSAEPPPKPPTPKTVVKPADPDALPVYRLAVTSTGLALTDPRGGAAKPADFGLRQSLLIAILARSFGPAVEGQDAPCGRDFARWSNGLTLWFEGGEFVGWERAADAPAIPVASGLAPDARKAGLICG
jgi:hypothetical protein